MFFELLFVCFEFLAGFLFPVTYLIPTVMKAFGLLKDVI